MYPPETIPTPPCPSIWLADLLANEEIACAQVGHIVLGTPGDYLELIQAQWQGCLVDIFGTLVAFFFFKSTCILAHIIIFYFLCFAFCENTYMWHFWASSSKEESPPPSNAGGSFSFSEVLNPDGSFSSMNLN